MRGYVEVKQCASISLLIWLTLSVVRVFSPEPSSSHGTASELSTGKRGMRDESQEGLTAGLLGSSYASLSTSGGVMGSKGDSGNLEATPTPCGQLGDAADPGCTHSSALIPRVDGARQAGPSTASAGLLQDELRERAAAAAAATTATASPSTPGFVACTPYASHDVAVERCESYCAMQHRSFHCRLCKCKACAFCRANASEAAGGRSADAEDGGVDRRGEREVRGRRGRRGRGRRGRGRGARARGASRGARNGEVHGRRGGAIADPLDEAEAEGEREEEVESVPTSATAAALASASASASERSVAVGVLTQSRDSPRWLALEATWIHQFDQVMVFESHTDVAKVQQIWKYIPQRLYTRFPSADFYLIIDDDVFINRNLLMDYLQYRSPHERALFGPGFCDWGVQHDLKAKASAALSLPMPDFIHIIIGGIMLFTSAAVKLFTDSNRVMQCIDDLETLYGNKLFLWGGLKESALYNQDWLFCWCLQVRMGGAVYVDNAFEDIDFPARKCTTLADAAQRRVGIHHVSRKRMLALWRNYLRAIERDGNRTREDDPARFARCALSSRGDPYEPHDIGEHRYLDSLKRPPRAGRCRSIVSFPEQQARYPSCVAHMSFAKAHPETSPCTGGMGHRKCGGFQLDINDHCNLQYYVYCEKLFKGGAGSLCPAPKDYPEHCCYTRALLEGAGRKRRLPPASYLLQVYPQKSVFVDTAASDARLVRSRKGVNASRKMHSAFEIVKG